MACKEAKRLYEALQDPRIRDGTFPGHNVESQGNENAPAPLCVEYQDFKAPPMQSVKCGTNTAECHLEK